MVPKIPSFATALFSRSPADLNLPELIALALK
jgi:hypothetical protein